MANKKPTKVLTTKKSKKDLLWAGGADLFGTYGSEKDQVKKNSLMVVAKAINITPFGANFLGGLPYINNMGLKDKLEQYHKEATFEYDWFKISETDDDKAICKVRLLKKDGKPLTPWILGEASPASMKMGTLKGYQNHLAQTRGENRCIRHAYGLRIHKELLENVAKMHGKGEVDGEVASQAISAASVTAEEMNVKKNPRDNLPTIQTEAKPTTLAEKFKMARGAIEGAVDVKTLQGYKKRIDELGFSDTQKQTLVDLMLKRTKELK